MAIYYKIDNEMPSQNSYFTGDIVVCLTDGKDSAWRKVGGSVWVESSIPEEATEQKRQEQMLALSGVVQTVAGGITKIWTGTQAQYDAIATKDDDTLYIIVEA